MNYPKIRAFLIEAGWFPEEIEIGFKQGRIWNAQRNYRDPESLKLVDNIIDAYLNSSYSFSMKWLDFLEKTLPEVKDASTLP
jgi:hypothetical protein